MTNGGSPCSADPDDDPAGALTWRDRLGKVRP